MANVRLAHLACGHVVPMSRNSYVDSLTPMEWCHKCGHARFVSVLITDHIAASSDPSDSTTQGQ